MLNSQPARLLARQIVLAISTTILSISVTGCTEKQPELGPAQVVELQQPVGVAESEPKRPSTFETHAQEDRDGFTTETTVTIAHQDLPDADRNPTDAERKRLKVKWGKVRLKEIELVESLEIPCKLMLVSEDGKTSRPVEWPQPVRVLLAKGGDTHPDWSHRHDKADTTFVDEVAGYKVEYGARRTADGKTGPIPIEKLPSGELTAVFWTSLLNPPVGGATPFQLGLCLGRKEGKKLIWTNVTPVLPQSITTIQIPATLGGDGGRRKYRYLESMALATPIPLIRFGFAEPDSIAR